MSCPCCAHCLDVRSRPSTLLSDLKKEDGLSVRVLNFFHYELTQRVPGTCVNDLTLMTERELLRTKNLGPQSVKQIREFLARRGLAFMP
jgi:DNA-directed RNA polymerase alpha subunit